MFKLSHVFIFACKAFLRNIRNFAPYENFPLHGTSTTDLKHSQSILILQSIVTYIKIWCFQSVGDPVKYTEEIDETIQQYTQV